MQPARVLAPSIPQRYVVYNEPLVTPFFQRYVVEIVRLGRQEDVGCFVDIEIFEKGLVDGCECGVHLVGMESGSSGGGAEGKRRWYGVGYR